MLSSPQKRSEKWKSVDDKDKAALSAQLSAVGLRIQKVTGDGNCFFRTACDQLEGRNADHAKLRQELARALPPLRGARGAGGGGGWAPEQPGGGSAACAG